MIKVTCHTLTAPSSRILVLKQLLKSIILNRAENSLLIALRAHKDKYLLPRINDGTFHSYSLKQEVAVTEGSGGTMQLSRESKKNPKTNKNTPDSLLVRC